MTHEPAPQVADRPAGRRDHLRNETTAHPSPLPRRIKVLVGGLVATAAIGGGTVAVAGTHAVNRSHGYVTIDTGQLTQIHDGEVLSLDQVDELNRNGKAMFTLNTVELACHGVTLYVDTEAETDAYGKGYSERLKAVFRQKATQGAPTPDDDPCAGWTAPVPELATQH